MTESIMDSGRILGPMLMHCRPICLPLTQHLPISVIHRNEFTKHSVPTQALIITMLQDAVNSAKNMLENSKRPQSDKVYKKQLLPEALKDDEVAIQEILAPLREVG